MNKVRAMLVSGVASMFMLTSCGDVTSEEIASLLDEDEKEVVEQADADDKEILDGMTDECQQLWAQTQLAEEEAMADEEVTDAEAAKIDSVSAIFVESCIDEIDGEYLDIPNSEKYDDDTTSSPEDDQYPLPDYCDVLLHKAESGDKEAGEKFSGHCLENARVDFHPDVTLSDACEEKYNDAYDDMKDVFATGCAKYFDEDGEQMDATCQGKMETVMMSTEGFYMSCEEEVKESNPYGVFPWDGMGGEGECHPDDPNCGPCEGPDCGPCEGPDCGDGPDFKVPYEEWSATCQEKWDAQMSYEATTESLQDFADACWEEVMPAIPPHIDTTGISEQCVAAYAAASEAHEAMFVGHPTCGELFENMPFIEDGGSVNTGSEYCDGLYNDMMSSMHQIHMDCDEQYIDMEDMGGPNDGGDSGTTDSNQ